MARRIGDVDEFEFKAMGENHNQGVWHTWSIQEQCMLYLSIPLERIDLPMKLSISLKYSKVWSLELITLIYIVTFAGQERNMKLQCFSILDKMNQPQSGLLPSTQMAHSLSHLRTLIVCIHPVR